MELNFESMIPYLPYYMDGLKLTFQITIISFIGALILAVILVFLGMRNNKIINFFVNGYISFFRGVPTIVQLFLIHFGISGITNNTVVFPTVVSGEITFALNAAAYLAESLRGGINGVDRGQYEASKALAVSGFDRMVYVIAPQALHVIFPSLMNITIKLIKDSAILSQLGAFELMRSAYYTMARSYRAFESLIVSAVFYFVIIATLTLISKLVEKRLNKHELA